MAKTTEHVGHIARMEGPLGNYLNGESVPTAYERMGLTVTGQVQIFDASGLMHTFAEIVGECDPDIFTEILTKEEANAKILSYFVPEIGTTCGQFFFEDYLRRFAPADQVYASLPDTATDADILQALKNAGCKFIEMTTYTGPLFTVD